MQYSLQEDGSLEPLPQRNIDTGLGLDRMAAIQQDVPSVFENDQFSPLVELGEELSGSPLRIGLPDHQGAARARRPQPRDELPDRRRRRALERGPRLHPAASDAARDPAGALDRHRVAVPGPVRGPGDRDHGRRVPGAARGARVDPPLALRRGGELRPHAGAGHAAAGGPRRARESRRHLVDRCARRLPAARHLRVPIRPHTRAAPARGAVRGRRGLPRADGGAARPRAHWRRRAPTAPRTSTSR